MKIDDQNNFLVKFAGKLDKPMCHLNLTTH